MSGQETITVYHLNDSLLDDAPSVFFGDLAEAQKQGKTLFPTAEDRERARIDTYEVFTDPECLLELMNSGARATVANLSIQQSHGLTAEGELRQLKPGS